MLFETDPHVQGAEPGSGFMGLQFHVCFQGLSKSGDIKVLSLDDVIYVN